MKSSKSYENKLNKSSWKQQLQEIMILPVGLSPADWLEIFWEKFDKLNTQLRGIAVLVPRDIQKRIEMLEVLLNKVHDKLKQLEPPRHQVVFVSCIKEVDARHGCAGELLESLLTPGNGQLEPNHGCAGEKMTISGTNFWIREDSDTGREVPIELSKRGLLLPSNGGHRLVTDFRVCKPGMLELTIPFWARRGYIGLVDRQAWESWKGFLDYVNNSYQQLINLLYKYIDIVLNTPSSVSPPVIYPTFSENNFFEGTIPEIEFLLADPKTQMILGHNTVVGAGNDVSLMWTVEPEITNVKVIKEFFKSITGEVSLDQYEILYDGSSASRILTMSIPNNPSLSTLEHPLYGEYTYSLEAINKCGTSKAFVKLHVFPAPIRIWTINMWADGGYWSKRVPNVGKEIANFDYKNDRASDLFGLNECRNKDVLDNIGQSEAPREVCCYGECPIVADDFDFPLQNLDKQTWCYTPECIGYHWRSNLHTSLTDGEHISFFSKQYGELGLLINGMKFEQLGNFIQEEILDTGRCDLGPPILILGTRLRIIATNFIVPFYTTHLRGNKADACRNIINVVRANWIPNDLPPIVVGDFNFSLEVSWHGAKEVMEEYFQEVRNYWFEWFWNDRISLDIGSNPSVTLDNNGTIVVINEVNMISHFPDPTELIYHIGSQKDDQKSIQWYTHAHFSFGESPSISINDSGNIVVIYKSANDNTLLYCVGRINNDQRMISWGSSHQLVNNNYSTSPSVTMNNDGNVVVVYEVKDFIFLSETTKLYYTIGKLNEATGTISFNQSKQFASSGRNPSITMNDNGYIVIVYDADLSGICRKLLYHVSKLNDDQMTIDMCDNNTFTQYANGINPAIAIDNNNNIVEVHNVKSNTSTLKYFSKKTKLSDDKITWGNEYKYDQGFAPSLTMNDSGTVIELHESENTNTLYYRIGKVGGSSWSSIDLIWVGRSDKFPSAAGQWFINKNSWDRGRKFNNKNLYTDHNCPSIDLEIIPED